MLMKEKIIKKSLHQFLPLSEAEIHGLLHPAQAKNKQKQTNSVVLVRKRTIPTERPPLVGEVSDNLGYFLARFQSLQLPSSQSEIPFSPKPHVSF
jgi:hypothetical protein